MSHQHDVAKLYTDEESKATIGSHQLPTPMGWKILIQPNQAKQKTKSGIILPEKAKENEAYLTAHGIVAAIGELLTEKEKVGQVGVFKTNQKLAIELLMANMLGKSSQ